MIFWSTLFFRTGLLTVHLKWWENLLYSCWRWMPLWRKATQSKNLLSSTIYIIMSRRNKKDYLAVSCRLMEVLGYIKTFKLCPSTPEIALDRQPSQGTPDTFNSYKNLCPFILLRHWVFFWTRNAVRCNLLVSPAFTFCLLGWASSTLYFHWRF